VFKSFLKTNDSEGTADVVGSELLGTVAQAFENRKYTLVVEPPLMDDWEKDPSSSRAISALDDQYDQQMFSNASPSDAPLACEDELKLTFDQYVKAMPNHEETQILVVIRGMGDVLTKGGAATSALGLGYGPSDYLSFSLGIIDGSTGHLVYSCVGRLEGSGFINKPSKLSHSVDACLQVFFVDQPKHSWIQ